MSSPHKAFEEATERAEYLRSRHDRLVPLAAAIIAVLAALGTLFSHHRSISALAMKNEAVLAQAKASDQYAYYEAKQIKSTLAATLLRAGVVREAVARATLQKTADHERASSVAILAGARELERQAAQEQVRSEKVLQSFETLEIATTLFEIAIVFVSISALSETRLLLYAGCVLSAIGIAFALVGYFQPH